MNDHSRLWKSRRSSLGKKESQLEGELETVSSDFEGKAKNILIGVAVVGVVVLGITLAARSSKKKKEKPQATGKKEKEANTNKTVVKRSFSFKNILIEKVTMAVLSFILTQIGHLIASAKAQETENKGRQK